MRLPKLLTTIDYFLQCPATVGYETPFISLLQKSFQELNCACQVVNGGLWIYPNNFDQYDVVFLSHIDRHGVIARQDGCVEYAALPLRNQNAEAKPYQAPLLKKTAASYIGEEIYLYDPKTGESVFTTSIVDAYYSVRDQYVRFGTSDTVPERYRGYPGALKRHGEQESGLVSGQLDNAISAAVLLDLIDETGGPAIFFSRQEEVGNSAGIIAREITREHLTDKTMLCLDTTPMDNFSGPVLNDVILRHQDSHAEFSATVNERIEESLDDKGLSFSFKDTLIEDATADGQQCKYGSTELGRLLNLVPGLEGASIQLPGTNYHRNDETVTETALRNYEKAVETFI